MPRVRRRLKLRRRSELSDKEREALLEGPSGAIPPDLERLQELWVLHREDLLAENAEAYPGCRPWAWWRWDTPEGREVIAFDGTPDASEVEMKRSELDSFGTPAMWPPRAVFESQTRFLERHGLLSRLEKKALAHDPSLRGRPGWGAGMDHIDPYSGALHNRDECYLAGRCVCRPLPASSGT